MGPCNFLFAEWHAVGFADMSESGFGPRRGRHLLQVHDDGSAVRVFRVGGSPGVASGQRCRL